MDSTCSNPRLLDKDSVPTARVISATIGARVIKHWQEIREFLRNNYEFLPELQFMGKKYGWCYKYRRKGKTLCVLFPEKKAFTVLVTLGKKEIEQVEENRSKFNADTQFVFINTRKYHDGKWIYRRILNKSDLKDVIAFIKIKKEPEK